METHDGQKNCPARKFETVGTILEKYSYDKEKLISILQAIQEEYRYLPQEVMIFVASALGISPAKIFGVATFYAHFALKPKGKYVIRICDGTACHVKGSMNLFETLQKILGLKKDQSTTSDLIFTLETVSCLGACGLAPAMVINEEVYGLLTPEKAAEIVETIKKKNSVV